MCGSEIVGAVPVPRIPSSGYRDGLAAGKMVRLGRKASAVVPGVQPASSARRYDGGFDMAVQGMCWSAHRRGAMRDDLVRKKPLTRDVAELVSSLHLTLRKSWEQH